MTTARIEQRADAFKLEGEVTIYRAAELKDELQQALAAKPHLQLDLSAVSELDSAGVQLLLWASLHAERLGGALRLRNCSPEAYEVIASLDLTRQLGADSAPQA